MLWIIDQRFLMNVPFLLFIAVQRIGINPKVNSNNLQSAQVQHFNRGQIKGNQVCVQSPCQEAVLYPARLRRSRRQRGDGWCSR